jgi:two-component system phosphate regulon sensor histidine kinase PhoR
MLVGVEPLIIVVAVASLGLLLLGAVARRRARSLTVLQRELGQRIEADAALRRRAARLDDLEARVERLGGGLAVVADLSGMAFVRLDDDARVAFANGLAHQYLERAPGTLVGQTAIEAFIDRRIEDVARIASERGFASTEVTLRAADGPTYLVRARGSGDGGAWIVVEDVSELRRLQRIRSEFTENLSHELRTPLSTISLLAETLANDAEDTAVPARMRDRIVKIEIETGHLVQMVNEILDLSRIEQGGPIPLTHDVDLARVAQASAERLKLFADRQGVELSVEVEQGIPPVRGDEDRLGQVLVNLLHNAVKFSPDGGPVRVAVRRDGEQVVVSVEDHGIGIPRAAQPRVFERFYKVDRARVRGGGTGLGLSISRHVVEAHGGRIWVISEEGRGSTFAFAIPVAAPVAPAPAATPGA